MFWIFFNDPIYEHAYTKRTCVYWVFKCMFLWLFSNYCHARKSIPVTEDDNILRNHKHFFTLQGWILKYLPHTETVYVSIKKTIKLQSYDSSSSSLIDTTSENRSDLLKNINNDLNRQFSVSKNLIEDDLKIVQGQSFNNIRINDGSKPFYLYFLLHYLVFIDIPFTLISSVMSLFQNFVLLSLGYYFAFVWYILVMILFPWINYKCLQIHTIFGNQEEDAKLLAKFNRN